jgi:hypothetical protein
MKVNVLKSKMETVDHFKNGVCPNSRTSRRCPKVGALLQGMLSSVNWTSNLNA